jgi:hypothetical protein
MYGPNQIGAAVNPHGLTPVFSQVERLLPTKVAFPEDQLYTLK